MADRTLKIAMLQRNDLSATWAEKNPVLLKGQIGVENDTSKFKFGDGVTAWNDLKYASTQAKVATVDPTENDYEHIDVGTLWVNTETDQVYGLVDNTANAAVWKRFITADEVTSFTVDAAKKLETPHNFSITGDASAEAVQFDGTQDVALNIVLPNTNASGEGTYTKLTVNAKGQVTSATTLTEADIPTLHLNKIEDAGTAASKDVGTSAGNVVQVGADGKIDTSVLPALAITETFPVDSESAMLALTAQKGDIAIRSDIATSFILASEPATELSNWLELKTKGYVLSVNGKTGAVTITTSDVAEGTNLYFTEERATANFNTNFPTKTVKDLTDGEKVLYEDDIYLLDGGNAHGWA